MEAQLSEGQCVRSNDLKYELSLLIGQRLGKESTCRKSARAACATSTRWSPAARRGAAEKLDTAASVVSRQIQLLEKELGVALFERRSRGLTPTEAADMLLEYRACRAQQEHLGARLQELRGMQRGSVQLMISEGFIDSLMEHVVGPFCIEHPRINISVNVGSVNEVVEAVASDAAHIGLAYNPPVDPRLRCRASRKHPVCLLTRPDHALARHRAPLTIADILPYPFALMSAPYGLRQAVDLLEFTERIHLTPSLTTIRCACSSSTR